MAKDIQYRWSLKTDNVYAFSLFYGEGFNASTLASHKNEVSGFVKKSNLPKLFSALTCFGAGIKDKKVRLITVSEYWKNWDRYN